MKRLHALLLTLPLVLSLGSCGSSSASEDSDTGSVAPSSEPSSDIDTGSDTESSVTDTGTDSSEPEEESRLSKLYGTYDLFAENYKALVETKANSISYFTKSSSYYDKPTKISVRIDNDEYLKTMTGLDSEGNDMDPEYNYYSLKNNEYYEVKYDGTIYSKAARYKISEETADGQLSDIITPTEASSKFETAKASSGNTVAKAVSTVDLQVLKKGSECLSYEFYEEEDGRVFIDYEGVYNGSYFGSYYFIELDMDKDGNITSGYFKKENYLNGDWDKENCTKVEGASPNSWFSSSISDVVYTELENTDMFDPSQYFATEVTGVTFHYYQSSMSGTSTERNSLKVGEYLFTSDLDFDNAVVTPETAIDIDSLIFTGSSDPAVIGASEETSWYFRALSAGTAVVTLGSSFKTDVCSVTIEVIEA